MRDRDQAIAYLKEDLHRMGAAAEDGDSYAQNLMLQFQELLLEILEPADWWIECGEDRDPDFDESLHSTAYVYFPAMDADSLAQLLWSLHRLTDAELLL